MKLLVLITIILGIIGLSVLFFNTRPKSDTQNGIITTPSPAKAVSSSPPQTVVCGEKQLAGSISTQGAAGNIYATLELTNTGTTACQITLGNSITAAFDASNIDLHYQQQSTPQAFMLAPSAKVYSQVHYPNGPQCSSGVREEQVTFFYKTDQTSVTFAPVNIQQEKVVVQDCVSPAERTVIDIWPLSKTPITP